MASLRPFRAVMLAFLIAACAAPQGPSASSSNAPSRPTLHQIADGVWLHKSYGDVPPWGRVLSHGLVIDTGGGVLLVDTAWTDEDTEELLALIEDATGALPVLALVTHAHADKMGGVGALSRAGVEIRAHPFTNADAPLRGLQPAKSTVLTTGDHERLFVGDARAGEHGGAVEVFYPGPGHTRDNIVVYYAPARILFGGCLIRPASADNLGNTADGDVTRWASSVRAVAARFPHADLIIPSHGPAGGRALLDHTIALAEAANAH